MATLFQWMLRAGFAALALIVLLAALLWLFLSRSLPEYDHELTTSGLQAPVEVVRDINAVPHIFGETDEDVFFGLGYAHAQDRLWQMMLLRRTVQGRLSEIFGVRTVQTDELMRRLDLYGLAARSVEQQDTETQAALAAYAAGVNARLTEINATGLGRGAPEFWLFEPQISPWAPADSIAILKLMGVQLSSHLTSEVQRAKTILALDDPDRLRDILPDAPGEAINALPNFAALFPEGWETRHTNANTSPPPLSPVPPQGLGGASNAFAVAPERAASGGSVMANDPHLGLTAPTIWYLARLDLASGGVIGGTIPGLPLILVGRSDQLGWGLTTAYLDDQDVFLEQLSQEDSTRYRTALGFRPFETRRSIIRIKDALPVTLTLRWSQNGPILPGTHFDLASVTPPGHVAALGWTLLEPDDRSISAGMRLMRAAGIDEALRAAQGFQAPAQMLTLADQSRVAMTMIGAMPRRALGNESQGRLPVRGWIEENRWQGRFSASDNPVFFGDEGGIVGHTNNKFWEGEFPQHISFDWGDTQRAQRWRILMQRREIHSRDSLIEAQLDTVSFTARSLLPLIGAELWFTGEAAAPGTPENRRQRALALLAAWNGEMNEHLPEPLIYAAWLRALQERLIRDDLGAHADSFPRVDPVFIERVFRDIDGASSWCDITQSAPLETCEDMARLALDDALVWLQTRYGTAIESLRWGDAHEARQDHPVLGNVPGLSYFVNIRQSTSGGDNTLMRGATIGTGVDPFANVHAAGYRGVYDFADPDASLFIISTGQSGHPLSRYYDNLSDLWRRGEYIPMSLDEALARAGAIGTTRLVPDR